MKKRMLPLLLAVLLLVTAAAATTNATDDVVVQEGEKIAAAADAMTFPEDGSDYTAFCPVCGKSATWTALTPEDLAEGFTMPNSNKHYYLTASVEECGVIQGPNSGSYSACLHLNGKDLTNSDGVVFQARTSHLKIMGSGTVKGGATGEKAGATVLVGNAVGSSISLYGGTYEKYDGASTANVIANNTNSGTVNLYAGATVNCGTAGSAVYLRSEMYYNHAVFNMYGGVIDASSSSEPAVDMEEDTGSSLFTVSMNMYGGTIYGGSRTYGGSVPVRNNVTLNMYGGTITGGTATTAGGNIYVAENGIFNMYGGTIANGVAQGTGGSSSGVGGGNVDIAENGEFNMHGGTITGGVAAGTGTFDGGGNVRLNKNAVFNMTGGTVSGTRDADGNATGGTAKNGGNIYLFTGAVFNMTGGTVENGTATTEGGNICTNPYYVSASQYATVTLENAIIRGGECTGGAGGNLGLKRVDLFIGEGTQISGGVAGTRGGNLRLYFGTVVMTGGRISGGTANYTSAGYEEVWLEGSSATLSVMYMLGGVIEGREQEYGSVMVNSYSRLYLGGDAMVMDNDPENSDIYTKANGKALVYICDGWSGSATIGIDLSTPISLGADVDTTIAQAVTLDADRNATVGGSFSGNLKYISNGAYIQSKADENGTLVVGGIAMVDADGNRTLTADPLTDWATGTYAYIQLCSDGTLSVPEGSEIRIDLNGHDLTVEGSGTVNAFDSAGDGYDATKCGTITNNGTAVITKDADAPNGNRYIALTDGSETTVHRLDMRMVSISLRTSAAGIYYKAAYNCDSTLAAAVTNYGVVFSVKNMPGADFMTEADDINRYTSLTPGEGFGGGTVATSGSIFNIMKTSYEDETTDVAAENAARGEMEIYANAYIAIGSRIIVANTDDEDRTVNDSGFSGTAYSLHGAMDKMDEIYYNYSLSSRERMDGFYTGWQEKGMDWSFVNIGMSPLTADNSDLSPDADGNALCPVCNETVTWTAVTQEAYGASGIGTAADGSHYYLAEDITYTESGSDAVFIGAPGSNKSACLHLNGHNITGVYSARVISGSAGTLNVMGNGTVSGNYANGATVYINTNTLNPGRINLYGGTYTKPVSNSAAIINARGGGNIYLYEGTTVRGTGNGYCANVGSTSLMANASLVIRGATITGGAVNMTAVETANDFTHTLEIGGNSVIEDVVIRDANATVKLSGVPVIDRVAMVLGTKLTLGGLSQGADIAVSTSGVFTQTCDNAEEYAQYFRAWKEPDSVVAKDGVLQYNINYEYYMTPYQRDVAAEAVADGKIHYYFMAGQGMVMSPTNSGEVDKWGDCCLIVFPNGKTMLVDSGYQIQAPVIIGNLKRMGVTKLDYVLITHPHSDHAGGVFGDSSTFLDEIAIGKVYYDGLEYPDNSWWSLVPTKCDAKGIPYEVLREGDTLTFGEDDLAVTMRVLWPKANDEEIDVAADAAENNNGIVFRLDYGEHSSLFTADIYRGSGYAENLLYARYGTEGTVEANLLDVDLIKVPHHGWSSSSGETFVRTHVTPELAVVTGHHAIPENVIRAYANATVLQDLTDGYIHVEAGADGTMEYETSQ